MIELKNISAGYGKESVLHTVSLRLPKNTLLAIVGPNGSGKSTLLKTMTGILPSSSGEVWIDRSLASDIPRQEIAKRIAYLAQGKSTPDMTVKQMVLHGRFPHLQYPRRYSKNDIAIAEKALEQMGIAAIADKPLSALSGGMRQKAYVAMALAQDTDYILLDEPTTYLDIAAQLELMKTVRTLADAGKGIAVVLHDLPLAFSFSDTVTVMQSGRICAAGTPEEISQSEIVEQVFGVRVQCADGKTYSYQYGSSKSKS